MFVTAFGITIDTRLLQNRNVLSGIVRRLVERVTDSRFVHITKTDESNHVTEFAIVTLVKFME